MTTPQTRRAWLGTLVTATFASHAWAIAPQRVRVSPIGVLLARIEAARTDLQTIEADFDQERVMGLFAQALRSRGKLIVQRPDSVRWEIVAPNPAVFVVSGGRVSMRTGNGTAATATQRQVGPLGAVLGDLATFMGGPLRSLLPRYRLELGATATTLVAIPTDAVVLRALSRLEMRFSADLRGIEAVNMQEPGGDTTRVTMRNTRINSGRVPANAFRV